MKKYLCAKRGHYCKFKEQEPKTEKEKLCMKGDDYDCQYAIEGKEE